MVVPRTAGAGGFPDWLISLFRLRCPVSSAIRAQVWFDLKSSGLPVLALGGALAIAIPLVFAVGISIDFALSGTYARPVALMFALFTIPAVLLLGGNAFGIRARQGRTYASVFDATQASGTGRMAALKVLVRSVSLLAALSAAVASFWISASSIPFDVLDDHDTFIEKARSPLSGWMRATEGALGTMTAPELIALGFVVAIVVAVMVAARAAHTALRARYPRRLNITGWLLLLHALVLVLLALATQRGIGSAILLDVMLRATNWIAATAIVLATVYLSRRVVAERLLTLRQAGSAIVVTAAFGVAWVTVLRAAGVSIGGMPTTEAVWMVLPVLLPLMASVLAPWSLSRVRHT
jgi:hypothetical protein